VIDFAEKFNAKTNRATDALAESDDDRDAVMDSYMRGEYQQAIDNLNTALAKLDEVTTLAMKAKDEALLWVYIIEWFTVSGTGMLCGAVLWTLMVKRSAYREVKVTRFNQR